MKTLKNKISVMSSRLINSGELLARLCKRKLWENLGVVCVVYCINNQFRKQHGTATPCYPNSLCAEIL